ncbi:MAG: hypothetical protein ACI4MJ_05850 [Aristaeellaceae bacterium]
MSAIVKTADVHLALTAWLGTALVERTGIAIETAQLLRGYVSGRDTLQELAEQLANRLFQTLYNVLGPSMTVRLDDGTRCRIHLSDLPDMADDALYALLCHLPVHATHYQMLKDYSLRAGSLSAMRVLYEQYDAFQAPEEKALMVRVIRGGYPPARYSSWLSGDA